jgi:hypothetical protein
MENVGGVYLVPIRINDTITLDAIVDSGASDVSMPADVVLTLIIVRGFYGDADVYTCRRFQSSISTFPNQIPEGWEQNPGKCHGEHCSCDGSNFVRTKLPQPL